MSWGPWRTIEGLVSAPGTDVAALVDDDLSSAIARLEAEIEGVTFQLFVADEVGGVSTLRGGGEGDWEWRSLSQGSTTPGAPVTAVRDGDLFQVFLADPGGGVFTARGSEAAGWGQWHPLSQGSTTPGAPVTAVLDGDMFQVFLADPGGGVFTARGQDQNWGQWRSLSQGSTTPGAPVTAILVGKTLLVFLADPLGGVFTARGQDQNWEQWQTLSQGTKPGAPVSAILGLARADLFVFISDPDGGISMTMYQDVPEPPTDLRVTGVGNNFVDFGWNDASDNEAGFRVSYHGTRIGEPDDVGTRSFDANTIVGTVASLLSTYDYQATVAAYNANGTSAESNEVIARTTNTPFLVTVTLVRQQIGPEGGTFQYAGEYPAFGSVQPGRVLSISVPPSNEVLIVRFAEEAGTDAYTDVMQGTTTTVQQMQQIFNGVATPPYTTTHPVQFIAVVGTANNILPEQVQITLKVETD